MGHHTSVSQLLVFLVGVLVIPISGFSEISSRFHHHQQTELLELETANQQLALDLQASVGNINETLAEVVKQTDLINGVAGETQLILNRSVNRSEPPAVDTQDLVENRSTPSVTIVGSLTYPSDAWPGANIHAVNVDTGRVFTARDHRSEEEFQYGVGYSMEVPPGEYFLYAIVGGPMNLGDTLFVTAEEDGSVINHDLLRPGINIRKRTNNETVADIQVVYVDTETLTQSQSVGSIRGAIRDSNRIRIDRAGVVAIDVETKRAFVSFELTSQIPGSDDYSYTLEVPMGRYLVFALDGGSVVWNQPINIVDINQAGQEQRVDFLEYRAGFYYPE